MSYFKSNIISNEKIAYGIYKMVVEDNNEVRPGQFYMLKLNGQTLLPRPISVCEKNNGTITFIYAVVGNGTKEYMNLKKGDFINLIGPLGNGFNIYENLGDVALVSGGIGIAPMLETAKKFKEYNNSSKLDLYAGFRDDVYLINEINEFTDNIYISTDTGKYGHKGFVTDILNVGEYDTILCCGPEKMMKKVIDMCKEKNVRIYVSMEKHMACGVGACLVCTCKTKDGHKRTCKDGPVFDGYYVEL